MKWSTLDKSIFPGDLSVAYCDECWSVRRNLIGTDQNPLFLEVGHSTYDDGLQKYRTNYVKSFKPLRRTKSGELQIIEL
jgi:hypothetical protein